MASVFLIIISISLFFIFNENHNDSLAKSEIDKKIFLSEEKIQLISGNEILNLNENTSIILNSEGEASLTDTDSLSGRSIKLSHEQINKLIVPFGKRTFLILSDGTQIWLNSGTKIEFPTKFQTESRNIYIEGEAYIDVVKSNNEPFIVHTKTLDIQVFGTQLNVAAYTDENKESVVLVEGKVTVSNKIGNKSFNMTPNDLIVISDNKFYSEKVDVNEYISWKKGLLVFNKTPMSDILKRIGRCYNIEFNIDANPELSQKTFSGKLYLSSDIDSVMISIANISSIRYEKNNKNIINILKK